MSPWVFHLLLASLGLALAALAAAALLARWRRRPVAAYRLLVLVLVAALLLPGAQVLVEGHPLPLHLPGARHLAALRHPSPSTLEPASAPAPAPRPEPDPEPEGPVPDSDPQPLPDPVLLGVLRHPATTELDPRPALLETEPPLAPRLLATLYLLGLSVALVRSTARLRRARRLLRDADPVRDPLVLDVWRDLAAASPIGSRVALLTTAEIDVPMCFGLRRPAILLPAAEDPALDPSVLHCVLLHELVHLERRDTWIMLAQEGLRTLFWFHPAAWWLCRKVDALRELSCDLLVVARTGRRKRYASALVEYAAWLRRGPTVPAPSTALLSWTSTKSQLARRIEMLVDLPTQRSRSRRATWLAATAFFGSLWSGQLALAAAATPGQEPGPEPAPEPLVELAPVPRIDLSVPEIDLEPAPGFALAPPAPLPRRAAPPAPLGPLGPLGPLAPAPPGAPRVRAPMPAPQDGTPMIGVRIRQADEGIVVDEVIARTPAERAGLRDGDVIVRIDGRPATFESLRDAKRRLERDEVVLEVLRGERTTEIELGPIEPQPRGWTVERRDRRDDALDRAREALEHALQEHPDDDDLASALKAVHEAQKQRQGERSEARDAYDRAQRRYRELDADDQREAREWWEKDAHKQAEKMRKEAEKMQKEALKHAEKARKEAEKMRKEALDQADRARRDAEKVRGLTKRKLHDEAERRAEREADAGEVKSTLDQLREELRRSQQELEELRRQLEELDRERARGDRDARGEQGARGEGDGRSAGLAPGSGPAPSGPPAARTVGVGGWAR